MTFKNPLRKNKRSNPETVISTFEDLLKFFDDSKQRAKAKSKVKVDFDVDFDDNDDADAGINADDDARDSDDDEPMVRVHDSGCRSDSADNMY